MAVSAWKHDIQLLEKVRITPSSSTNLLTKLSALDLVIGNFFITGLYFFSGNPDCERLKSSLRQALDLHPNFGGSLERDADGVHIRQDATGSDLSLYRSDQDCPDFQTAPPFTQSSSFQDAQEPLLYPFGQRVPVTTFKVILYPGQRWALVGRFLHSLTDLSGFNHFMHCWSRLYSGEPAYAASSFSRQKIAELAGASADEPSPNSNIVRSLPLNEMERIAENSRNFGTIQVRIDQQTLHDLIQSCRHAAATPLSRSDVLHALTWKAFSMSARENTGTDSHIATLYDIRRITEVGIPADYEGNAVIQRKATCQVKFLHESPLAEVALSYHRQIKPLRIEEIRQDIAFLDGEYKKNHINADGRLSHAIFGSLEKGLSGQGTYINDLTSIDLLGIKFGSNPEFYETLVSPGVNIISIYHTNNGEISFRKVGHKKSLASFVENMKRLSSS